MGKHLERYAIGLGGASGMAFKERYVPIWYLTLLICVEAGFDAGGEGDFEGIEEEADLAVITNGVGHVDDGVDADSLDRCIVDFLADVSRGDECDRVVVDGLLCDISEHWGGAGSESINNRLVDFMISENLLCCFRRMRFVDSGQVR